MVHVRFIYCAVDKYSFGLFRQLSSDSADCRPKEYKITLNVQGFKIIKVLLQIVAIYYLSNGYVYWMILEVIMSITAAVILDRLLKREYPWLQTTISNGKELSRKYPQIITKTKQVFFIR